VSKNLLLSETENGLILLDLVVDLAHPAQALSLMICYAVKIHDMLASRSENHVTKILMARQGSDCLMVYTTSYYFTITVPAIQG
jgi:hypothetical protein